MEAFNNITLLGNLTRDVEIRPVGTTNVGKFGLAVNRQFKDKNGKVIQEVCFVDIEVWGPQADNCAKCLKKGMRALVDGRLKYETWKDKEGKERSKHVVSATSVTFIDKPTDTESHRLAYTPKPDIQVYMDVSDRTEEKKTSPIEGSNLENDELPF